MKRTRFLQLLGLAAVLGLGVVVFAGTEARAACYGANVSLNRCYSWISWYSGTKAYTCDTPQAKWCQRVNPTGTFAYTPVTMRNWGSYSEVATAANLWNESRTSTTAENSLYLHFTTNSTNDIDVENINAGATGWWGITDMPYTSASNGCLPRGSMRVRMNTYYISGSSSRRMHTALHEIAHAFGLGHTSQSHVMNPQLGISTLTDCDKKGVDSLYP
jgi:hypothetical protein